MFELSVVRSIEIKLFNSDLSDSYQMFSYQIYTFCVRKRNVSGETLPFAHTKYNVFIDSY